MHLTNYSINKKNANFQRSADVSTGSKRSISYLTDYLRRKDYDVAILWKDIAVSSEKITNYCLKIFLHKQP